MDKPIKVTLFRHGESEYTEQPLDLTGKGVLQVLRSGAGLGLALKGHEEIALYSSPRQRTLYTVQLIARTFAMAGIKAKESRIRVDLLLDEVGNFSWPLFLSLVEGGEVQIAGETFHIDKSLTNPLGLAAGRYFNDDAAQWISDEARQKLPPAYLAAIDAMETFDSVISRLRAMLTKIVDAHHAQIPKRGLHVVIVTHDALAGYPAEVFTNGRRTGIKPGESIDIDLWGDRAFVTRVGSQTVGRSDVDLFE